MKTKTMVVIMLLIAALMIIFQLLDFLALHDIYHEYASPATIGQFASSSQFPDWTSTTGEWKFIKFSYWVRLSLIIFIFILLGAVNKRTKLVK